MLSRTRCAIRERVSGGDQGGADGSVDAESTAGDVSLMPPCAEPDQDFPNAWAASRTVSSTSAVVCAAETKPASNALGAKYTPASSMRWKNRLNASLSLAMTSA